jgi:hypothetical protein
VLEENQVNPETYIMLELMEKIDRYCMNSGTYYDQRSCATCGSMTTRLRENGFSLFFSSLLPACQKKHSELFIILYVIAIDKRRAKQQ